MNAISAIIFDSNNLFQWQVDTVFKLIENKSLDVKLLILAKRSQKNYPIFSRLFFEYSRLNKRLSFNNIQKFAKNVNVEILQININGNFLDFDSIIDGSKFFNLHFILDFTTFPLRGNIDSISKWGIWKFKFTDNFISQIPVGYEELKRGEKIISAQLICFKSHGISYLINEVCVGTFPFSYFKTVRKLFYHTNYLVNQSITAFANQKIPSKEIPIEFSTKAYPSNFKTILFIIRQLIETFSFFWERGLYTDKWNIGYINKPIHSFLSPISDNEIIWIDFKKKNKFIADPFVYKHNDNSYLIYEELDYNEGVGYINSAEINGEQLINEKLVFKESFHFSYPYISYEKGEVYCIPETSESKEISLYKLLPDGQSWDKIKTLVTQFKGIDSTVFFYNDYWWMFSTQAGNRPHEIVYLFYSKSLGDKWESHSNNPVKIDIRSARGAGTPFIYENVLYRPAQDYSEEIEGRIRLNKIIKLSPTEFEEQEVCIINPFKLTDYPHKIHTLCDAGDFTVIDGCKKVFILSHPSFLLFKVKRIFKFILKKIVKHKH